MSRYTARAVTDPGELVELHDMAAGAWTPEHQCSPGAWWPSMGQLRRAHAVYGAWRGDRPVAVAVVAAGGHVEHLAGVGAHLAAAMAAIAPLVRAAEGTCWGRVANPTLRAAIAAATTGMVDQGPDTCRVGYRQAR